MPDNLLAALPAVVDGEVFETLLEALRRHRVLWTDPEGTTVWLAFHLPGDAEAKA